MNSKAAAWVFVFVAVMLLIVPGSLYIAAPALLAICHLVREGLWQVVGKFVEKINATGRCGESGRLRASTSQVPAGDGDRTGHGRRDEPATQAFRHPTTFVDAWGGLKKQGPLLGTNRWHRRPIESGVDRLERRDCGILSKGWA